MSSLEMLGLGGNNLSGHIPTNESFRLPRLRAITLHRNKLNGEIPSSFAYCPYLQTMSLCCNQFTGVVPMELSSLPELRFISLGENHLTGTIPASLTNITKLNTLDLDQNNLHGGVPEELKWLNLGGNNLTGTIPNSLTNASMLNLLDLSYNNFIGSVPTMLGNLANLTFLNLEGNQLVGELDFLTSLSNCKNLVSLYISDNQLDESLPDSVGNLSTQLLIFSAHTNHIKGKIPAAFGNLRSLLFLSLYKNRLTGTIPLGITRLEKLQVLKLYANRLDGPIPNEIGRLRNLGRLHLDQNMLSGSIPDSIANISGLQYLTLSGNRLSSTIPRNIWSLKELLYLNLNDNLLEGFLPPDVGNLQSLVVMNLSSNRLTGSLPSTMGDLQMLKYLDLSHNSFQGLIPQSFGRLISINSLNLSSNTLSGAIPKSVAVLPNLVHLNLSFNKLEGQIPNGSAFANLTVQSFMGNAGLCGGASRLGFPPCSTDYAVPDSRSRLRLLKYILPPIASILVLAAFFYLMLTYRRRRTMAPVLPTDTFLHVKDQRLISYNELVRATDSFSEANLLGKGSFGSVFRGRLDDGVLVAVKVLNLEIEGASKSFDAECNVMRMVRHRNLVKIINTCSNLDFKALILQFMSNGSLEKWLYSHNYCLSLLQRLDIVMDVAMALEYLHHNHFGIVVHCDLKPINVLLDEDMTAHLGDFGISKLLVGDNKSTASICTPGTIGYIAPEYGSTGKVSRQGDVYSYGILLLETFTRRKPTDAMFAGTTSLRQWVNEAFPNAVMEVVDSNLLRDEARASTNSGTGEGRPREEQIARHQYLSSVIELGLLCSRVSPKERIQMKEVVMRLKKMKTEYLSVFASA